MCAQVNQKEILATVVSIQQARFDNGQGQIGSSFPQVGKDDTLERLTAQLAKLSGETGISVNILEIIGSLHVSAKLAIRDDKSFIPERHASADQLAEIEKLGFPIPQPVYGAR